MFGNFFLFYGSGNIRIRWLKLILWKSDTCCFVTQSLWRLDVVVITTAQLHSTEPELRLCAGSNPARGLSEIRGGEDLWQWSRQEIRLNSFRPTIPLKQFIIIIIIISERIPPLLGLFGAGGDREKRERWVSPTGWGYYFSRGEHFECHEE